ncbi:hypothetical protein PR048_008506 [Dryococelus australis]|uniref:Tektin n=1 Tax=Dryococelus australis TaxID=614101 RepID=A0ABQ9HXM4_9NEOP|nr:hypothetical protein PR048_008506 [Dryococelus australis]
MNGSELCLVTRADSALVPVMAIRECGVDQERGNSQSAYCMAATYRTKSWHHGLGGSLIIIIVVRVDIDSRQAVDVIAASTDKVQLDSTKLLQQRAHDVHHWKTLLERTAIGMGEEINLLEDQRQRLRTALGVLRMPESIAGECLDRRTARLEPDLVRDHVEEELIKVCCSVHCNQLLASSNRVACRVCLIQEVALVSEVGNLMQRMLKRIEEQLTLNKAGKQRVECDWSNKKEAYEIETTNIGLRNTSPDILFHPGATRFSESNFPPPLNEAFRSHIQVVEDNTEFWREVWVTLPKLEICEETIASSSDSEDERPAPSTLLEAEKGDEAWSSEDKLRLATGVPVNCPKNGQYAVYCFEGCGERVGGNQTSCMSRMHMLYLPAMRKLGEMHLGEILQNSLSGSQSTPETWEHYSKENLEMLEAERERSKDLRMKLEVMLTDMSRDLRTQADHVDSALSCRIAETSEALRYFENDLLQVW